jgi:hypothetical protein
VLVPTLLYTAFTNLKNFSADSMAETLHLYCKSSHVYVIFIQQVILTAFTLVKLYPQT